MTDSLDAYLTIRVPRQLRTEFHRKAKRYGKPSEVLREIVEAFNDGRLTIQPPVNSKKESLYEPRS